MSTTQSARALFALVTFSNLVIIKTFFDLVRKLKKLLSKSLSFKSSSTSGWTIS